MIFFRAHLRGLLFIGVIMNVIEKRCGCCGETKPLTEFSRSKSANDGHQGRCKGCQKKAQEKYRATNLEKIRERDRITHRQKRAENPELIRSQDRARYAKTPEKFRKRGRDSYHSHPEKMRARQREWTRNNKWYVLKSGRERRENPSFAIGQSMRGIINTAIKKNYRGSRAPELLGCSLKSYREYIESLWKPGMSWDNWGVYGWHIDHIIPTSFFDLTENNQVIECFNYKNTQPLWAFDNMSKSNKIIGGLQDDTKVRIAV